MKKQKMGGREPVQEIVSINDELFSLVTGDPLAALDERLARVAGMGAASLYKSVGAASAHDVKKTAAQPQSNGSERPATEGQTVAPATRPIDGPPSE